MIAKQPNGKYAVYNNMSDNLIAFDLTKPELVEFMSERAAQRERQSIEMMFDQVESGLPFKQIFRSDMTFKAMLKSHVKHKVNCADQAWNKKVGQKMKGKK